jgi:hypothetical protein
MHRQSWEIANHRYLVRIRYSKLLKHLDSLAFKLEGRIFHPITSLVIINNRWHIYSRADTLNITEHSGRPGHVKKLRTK